jgi:hypothetical protein
MSRSKLVPFVFATAASLALAGAPVASADSVEAGSDVWKTDASGSYVSFVRNPIPAGFFCAGSPAFSGTIELTGRPLVTSPRNALRGADTVVVRDRDAVFSADGIARVSGRLVALSLAGDDLTVACDGGPITWDVLVYADDPSVTSDLTVVRESSLGGTFSGTLRVPAVIRFTNAADPSDTRELDNDVDFSVPADAEWTDEPGGDGWSSPAVSVDANADGRPETAIPAASDFFPGTSPNRQPGCNRPPCPVRIHHTGDGHSHLVRPPPECRDSPTPTENLDGAPTASASEPPPCDDTDPPTS